MAPSFLGISSALRLSWCRSCLLDRGAVPACPRRPHHSAATTLTGGFPFRQALARAPETAARFTRMPHTACGHGAAQLMGRSRVYLSLPHNANRATRAASLAAARRVSCPVTALADLALVESPASDPVALVALWVRPGDPAAAKDGAPDADDPQRPRVASSGQRPDDGQDERSAEP